MSGAVGKERLSCVVVLLSASAAQHAGAAPSTPATVSVTSTPEASDCPSADALALRVSSEVGQAQALVSGSADAPLHFSVEFSKSQAGYRSVLRAKGQRSGKRVLDDISTECDGVAAATSIALALIVEDVAAQAEATAAEPAEPPLIVAPRPQRHPRRAWRSPNEPTSHADARAFATSGATIGVFDAITSHFSGGFELDVPHASLGVAVGYLPGRSFQLGGGSVELELVFAKLNACHRAMDEEAQLRFCAAFYGGRLRATGSGFDESFERTPPWWATGVDVELAMPVTAALAWTVRASASVPLFREQFVVQNATAMEELPPIGVFLSAGAEFEIW
ncbi:MAG: hypothetical protein R3B13_09645 [Polyangiaceae bacterium]